ncbi:serine O-acetyltransferase [Dysgonomonas sp. PFB1-18]|uniref:hypothetical protein n=1 Tax=unclassified Dysgonomonas TaxID=2630389 RepID=UPI002473F331|nr:MULTISPECIES: hypothetical protein [unclassified Dysgonomonas]MDH6307772.1 serine O-acetyltransferase [Dysgonomonas sp. PF1-14]MDH6337690.1 serine O-acetyltransferase [Dysgonomonas sp. PF1-16]MDH6378914.1 serine O-acetyltransferase [Dysgonomonas sp. PFB1-18]MDH6396549.1 serine O-acetyltransferase [Dysgonomonas sp. PF1-23]
MFIIIRKIISLFFIRLPYILKEYFFSLKYYSSLKPVRSCCITKGINYIGRKKTILPHPIGIVIGRGVVLGENCAIYQNVSIVSKQESYPIIGDNVTIYANAVLIGKIRIGNNVVIGGRSCLY